MKVRKAVIPAAGLGTRVLPASKAIPKEMLPIVDKPAIQYIVEEAVRSGIEEILIITSRGKTAVEDHFDHSPELEKRLADSGKEKLLSEVQRVAEMANIQYVRQKEMKGLGHAILCAKSFVGNEPFAVLYGDDVIIGENPACKQLCEAYEEFGLGVVGIKEGPSEDIRKYSSLSVHHEHGRMYMVDNMIEKPAPGEEFSNFSILGRCVLPPKIFEILEHTAPGAGGEIQLTDAMKELAVTEQMIGVDYEGTRYDMGNKLGILQASIEVGLAHEEIGEGLRSYLKELAKTL